MELMELITEVVKTVGFPIAMAVALFWYITKLTEAHKEESKTMMESLNQNTTVLAELKELISVLINKEK